MKSIILKSGLILLCFFALAVGNVKAITINVAAFNYYVYDPTNQFSTFDVYVAIQNCRGQYSSYQQVAWATNQGSLSCGPLTFLNVPEPGISTPYAYRVVILAVRISDGQQKTGVSDWESVAQLANAVTPNPVKVQMFTL